MWYGPPPNPVPSEEVQGEREIHREGGLSQDDAGLAHSASIPIGLSHSGSTPIGLSHSASIPIGLSDSASTLIGLFI